jgi:Carbohydrate binding module (family 6)
MTSLVAPLRRRLGLALGAALFAATASATPLPARIEAESYTNMSGVQTEGCTEGGQDVGWIDAGDWMVYPISVPQPGSYVIQLRVASPNSGGVASLDLDAGSTVLGTIAIPNTGGWQSWTTVSTTVSLGAGDFNLGVYAATGGWNLNWIDIAPAAPTSGTTAYQDCGYGGYAVGLGEGRYTLSSLLARGARNDDLSSLTVAPGYHVVLYGDDGFTGPSMVTDAATACLVDRGFNDVVSSLKVLSNGVAAPPASWQEHWFEHDQLLSLVFQDQDVAVYFDDATPRSIGWMNKYVGDAWRYTKRLYGDLDGSGDDQRLYAVFHTGKYGGGHPSYYFSSTHDYRNVIDLGAGPWDGSTGWNLDATTHEIAHIVESATSGTQNSPAFGLWRDSKWAEIYVYDVYVGLGLDAEAGRVYADLMTRTDDFPVAGTQWFKNWFYPIWNGYGRGAVLARFFRLMAQNFPRNGAAYARDMNWGEFVHFWSGAAGVNLKAQATIAFGWSSTWEQQFEQAQRDFPNVKYQ